VTGSRRSQNKSKDSKTRVMLNGRDVTPKPLGLGHGGRGLGMVGMSLDALQAIRSSAADVPASPKGTRIDVAHATAVISIKQDLLSADFDAEAGHLPMPPAFGGAGLLSNSVMPSPSNKRSFADGFGMFCTWTQLILAVRHVTLVLSRVLKYGTAKVMQVLDWTKSIMLAIGIVWVGADRASDVASTHSYSSLQRQMEKIILV